MADSQKVADMIATKKAEIQAKLAAMRSGQPAYMSSTPPAPMISATDIDIQRKIAEARARLASNTNPTNLALPTPPVAGPKAAPPPPMLVYDESGKLNLQAPVGKNLLPKPNFATVKANQRITGPSKKKEANAAEPPSDLTEAPKNPYYEPLTDRGVMAPKQRNRRALKFNQVGKFVHQANQIRAKEMMDKLRKDIAERAKKAGMEVDSEIPDKAVKKEPPPLVEWWDAALLSNKSYDDIDSGLAKIDTEDSIITLYVQHPVPIRSLVESGAPAPKTLMLTKREQKKLRRQRRAEAQKDKQDKIRLGLLPPDPPKVKLSNLMRVLQNEAIQDPTKMEAKVRKEVEARRVGHEKANAENKLTEEEAREKKRRKLAEETANLVHVAVFKVHSLSSKLNRYKIEINAQQYNLTGLAIVHGRRNLVILEGGPKGIRAYKKLMLRRINWDEGVVSADNDTAMKMDDEKGPNRCFLVWEGEVKKRAFNKFGFKPCESEKSVRERLARHKVEHYWDAAIGVSDEELAMKEIIL